MNVDLFSVNEAGFKDITSDITLYYIIILVSIILITIVSRLYHFIPRCIFDGYRSLN